MPWAYAGVVEALSWMPDDWLSVLAVLLEGKLCDVGSAHNCVYCADCANYEIASCRSREWREVGAVVGEARVIG